VAGEQGDLLSLDRVRHRKPEWILEVGVGEKRARPRAPNRGVEMLQGGPGLRIGGNLDDPQVQ
jgi:hypothetical protein